MQRFQTACGKSLSLLLALALLCVSASVFAQQATGSLRGQVLDEFGGAIVGATITLVDASGTEKTATTNDQGIYNFNGLGPATYTVRAAFKGFAPYENSDVTIAAGQRQQLDIKLAVAIEAQQVTVNPEGNLNTEPENNAGAIVLKDKDIENLPDDPDDLASALQAMAGPGAGPNGGQIFVDGFSNGNLPPKEAIREIRINSNPFSSEYDRLGFGRIEILTRPGSDRFRGSAFFNFNDEALNSRNPFAQTRAPYQARQFGLNFGGPIVKKKASFFLEASKRDTDDNTVINATILDPSLNIVGFRQTVLTPRRRVGFEPRLDYQINQNNTLVVRYEFNRNTTGNAGLNELSLPSRAYSTTSTNNTLQLTETSIINQKIVNETRFQFFHNSNEQNGDNSIPTINVLDAFTGGGAQIGQSFNRENRWELTNTTSWTIGAHALKAGARFRNVSITDVSRNNFGGTFTFTTLDLYRNTILRAAGARPTQFLISGGNPQATVSQFDFGGFIQDDWRVRPNFTLSAGLRYENQTNIHSNFNFAPRLSFAWSPAASANKQSKTVLRGGFGVFYDRFAENLTLQTNRFNGTNQQQYLVTDPTILSQPVFTVNGVTNVPTIASLTAFRLPQTTRVVAPNLEAPYTLQGSFSVEHQLPYNTTVSVTYISTRTLHMLRTRNINAPVVPLGTVFTGTRPPGIYQYESSGHLKQNQIIFGVQNRLNRNFSIFARYSLSKANSDTDGAGTFPSYTYDLTPEYGRATFDTRHSLFLGGNLRTYWGLNFAPMITVNSGRPFNITIGRDLNGDGLFTERPAFATDLSRPSVVVTKYGAFDLSPIAGQTIIPRNYAQGPSFFGANLRIAKTIGFGALPDRGGNRGQAQRGGAGGGSRGGMMGGMGGGPRGGGPGGPGGGMFGGGGETGKRYNLTIGVNIQNLFNNVNFSTPVGNLSSINFGRSLATAGAFGGFGPGGFGGGTAAANRRIELQLRFNF